MSINKDLPISVVLLDNVKLPVFCDTETGTDIILPEAFGSAGEIFYEKLSDGKALFSCDLSATGVWLYESQTKSWTQLLETGSWNSLQKLPNGDCLIGSEYFAGLHVFENSTNTVINIPGTDTYLTAFQVLDNGNCLIGGLQIGAVLLYHATTKTITRFGVNSTGFIYYHLLSNGDCLIGGISNGVLLYNNNTETVSKIYSEGSSWLCFAELANGECLIFSDDSGVEYGLLFDPVTSALTNIPTQGRVFDIAYATRDGGCLLSSSLRSTTGVYYYDPLTKQIVQKYTSSISWLYFKTLENDNCLISSSATNTGILLFDNVAKTVSRKHAKSNKWNIFEEQSNGDCVIKNNQADVKYTLIYEQSTNNVRVYSYLA